MVSQDSPIGRDTNWSASDLVPNIGQGLADLLGRRVYHHRTWLGVGENVMRTLVFYPKVRGA
jgi:hypothetical protein